MREGIALFNSAGIPTALMTVSAAPVGSVPLTHQIASWAASLGSDDITPQARRWATHALLDWAAVTLAAKCEPLVSILADELATDQPGRCTVVGQGRSTSPLNAALINGAAAHALDYDDVSRAMKDYRDPMAQWLDCEISAAQSPGRRISRVIRAGGKPQDGQ